MFALSGMKKVSQKIKFCFYELTLRRPLRRKVRMRWFFDVSKVKESSFFKSDLTDPPQIFDAHLLENNNLNPSSFHFSVDFYIKKMFIHTNQPLITSFYIKKVPFSRMSDESALIRNFSRSGRVRG